MRIVTTVSAMQRLARGWKRKGQRVGFVPTMGYLHDGHVSLMRRAKRQVGGRGVVVVSIYVNPTQFSPGEDLAKYPRDLPRDKKLCRDAGVDVLFVPGDKQMFPGAGSSRRDDRTVQGDGPEGFSTYVVEESVSRGTEGASRPTHFRGVTTVVAKLFNIVLPDAAVFGAKDFQQAAVVKRMTRDLNFPVKMVVAPTIREADGLALSSRNKYLSPAEREQAVALWQAIQQARDTLKASKVAIPAGRLSSELKWLIETRPSARVDYIEFFDPETLQPVAEVRRGAHLALAVFVGKTRLIDNGRL
ncbi:MAG TPA: pantoate--beta-alanine ligase [Verrucomicrobiae bacterium]|nr:pantoate--beta-alanine ligase [Verrucomicrobiae bacterium]